MSVSTFQLRLLVVALLVVVFGYLVVLLKDRRASAFDAGQGVVTVNSSL